MDYLNLIRMLVARSEGPCLEFKRDNQRPELIGESISALSNSALLEGEDGAFMVWGVDDATHEIVGTSFYPYLTKKGNEDLINWLSGSLENVEFVFRDMTVDGKHVVILAVYPPAFYAATFQNNAYFREGSHTKPILKMPEVQKRLWTLLDTRNHEMIPIATDLNPDQVLSKLDLDALVRRTGRARPTDNAAALDLLMKDKVVQSQSDGMYSISLFGALLFARDLTEYELLLNKTVRIVKYDGSGRADIQRQFECKKGYAVQFDELMNYVSLLLPSKERIIDGIMTSIRAYPPDAVREVIVNALMHQDLTDLRRPILIEIFDGRMEVTNPGKMMVDRLRVVDWIPETRNRHLAMMMRAMGMCESIGSGWDRIVASCEALYLPAPDLITEDAFTKVVLRDRVPFSDMSREDRVWAAYLHACRMHELGYAVTNRTLRERFGLDPDSTSSISRLLTWTCDEGLIKIVVDGPSKRDRRYVPFWA